MLAFFSFSFFSLLLSGSGGARDREPRCVGGSCTVQCERRWGTSDVRARCSSRRWSGCRASSGRRRSAAPRPLGRASGPGAGAASRSRPLGRHGWATGRHASTDQDPRGYVIHHNPLHDLHPQSSEGHAAAAPFLLLGRHTGPPDHTALGVCPRSCDHSITTA